MKNAAVRLAVVIGVVVLVHGGFYVVRAGTRPAEVDPELLKYLEKALPEMPLEWGSLKGEAKELPHEIFIRTGAQEVCDREYHDKHDKSGQKISAHVALFTNPAEAVYHSPFNCYRGNGWTRLQEITVPLKSDKRAEISVSLTTWERKGEKILVLYWYEVGEHTLFGRFDLWKIRWAMRGQTTWPPMFKVLLQAPAADATAARVQLLDLAGRIRDWLGDLTAMSNNPVPASN